jgi:hypothetical protein
MFRAFLAHPHEILYCMVRRYGKRKCALWCPVVWCGRYEYDARNHKPEPEPKTIKVVSFTNKTLQSIIQSTSKQLKSNSAKLF